MDIYDVLKPCPFCGRSLEDLNYVDIEYTTGTISKLSIDCECGAEFVIRSDDIYIYNGLKKELLGKNAIEKWNTRAVEKENSNE